ncbi:MAG: DNA translocase FtsK [Proteobacteria bacterium]|nr:DNA translocase FtsK [Pseudomonadota bacterium]
MPRYNYGPSGGYRRNASRLRILPETVAHFFSERLKDAWGLCLLGAGAFTSLALLSYTPTDPSFNNTSATPPFNAGGVAGAYLADSIIQFVGLAGLVPATFMIVRGVMVLRRTETVFGAGIRFLFIACATIFASIAMARMAAPALWEPIAYLGGIVGAGLLSGISNLFQGWLGSSAFATTAITCGIMATMLGALSLGLPAYSWGDIGRVALAATAWCAMAITSLYQRIRDWFDNSESETPKRARATTAQRMRKTPKLETSDEDESEDETEGEEEPVLRAVRPSNDMVINKPKKKEKEKTKHQSALSLQGDNSDWEFPDIEILQEAPDEGENDELDERALKRNAELLQQVLEDFNISGEIVRINPGPVVTLYELEPSPGTKSSRVIGLSDDIARSMASTSVRAAVVPGRNVIGIEIPNKKRRTVYMRSLLSTEAYADTKHRLPLVLGKDIGGDPIIADLARMPHLLVAGTTGSGKSVAVNTMICSLLYKLSPEKCRFIMIDPKMLELSIYDDIPHLLSPVVTEPGKAIVALKWTVHEMEERYRAMSKLGVRNIDGYNARIREAQQKGEVLTRKIQTGFDPETGKPIYEEQPIELIELPYIVVVVDEFADLMLVAGKEVENAVQRLAQMARAAGIHLIMATQRPSVDVITGIIKANFPTRISFQVTSKIDSRTILNEGGAEQLLGMGDMLYMAPGGRIQRVHGPFIADNEVQKIVEHLRAQGEPQYLETITQGGDDDEGSDGSGDLFGNSGDDLYDQAVAIVAREGKASTSFLQRHLQIGYNRAATLIEKMEKQGVISPANHVGKRDVLIGER